MIIEDTGLKDSFLFKPKVFEDARGYFFESFKQEHFINKGLNYNFIQDNESYSQKGVLRGLHYQIGDAAQAKLVRVVKGAVLDVIVDIRPNSKTFGQHYKVVLSGENKWQLLAPRGFAHGFLVLEDNTIFAYKCDNIYNKEAERGIIYNDETLSIDWGISEKELLLSEKDLVLPTFKEAEL